MIKYFKAAFLVLLIAGAVGAQTPGTRPTPTPNPPVAVPNTVEDCRCEDKPLPRVLAVVNGLEITEFEPEVQQRVRQLQEQVIEARKRELDLQINSRLLETEAKKRGVSTTRLLEDEVVARTAAPTPAEAENYFNQNRARLEQQAGRTLTFADLKDELNQYLRVERQQERAKAFATSLRASADLKILLKELTPSSNAAERARVAATLNGSKITAGDLEDSLLPLIAGVQEEVYLLRKRSIDQKINDTLLTQEAQKRGVNARVLLDAEVRAKVPIITEAQALDFYNKNKERINGDFSTLKSQIMDYLQTKEQDQLESAFAERLQKAANLQRFLTPPAPPVFQIAIDDQPMRGNSSAAVTVVEFTDYECPSCGTQYSIFERLMSEYSTSVRFVVRDFPLEKHAKARKAAEAAEAAREQGKYWEYAAMLFRNQSSLDVPKLKEYATLLGLDRAKFDSGLDGNKFAANVDRDLVAGEQVGVNGTPSFFVNGRRVKDITYEGLKAAIEAALKPTPGR